MSDTDGAVADSGSIASNEPVIAATPAPISTEPRPASPAQIEETARQAAEAKAAADAKTDTKVEPKKGTEPEKAKPLSTRDALRKAAEKVNAEPAKPTPEKTAPLKDDGPARSEDGKFAPKDTVAAVAKDVPKADQVKPADAAKPTVDAKTAEDVKPEPAKPSYTASEPPKRFSPDAKEAWAAAPDSVRAEVSRMEKELTQGYEKHRNDAEAFNNVREFDEMAKKSGTDLKTALTNYTNMEKVLRADPIKGLELICQNAGLSLKDVAAHVMGQTPEQNASQTDATIRELRATVQQLEQKVGGVTQTFEQQRTQTTHESVTKFAADHPRFEELSDDIAFFLKTRTKDLAEAYSLAERLNPAPVKAEVIPPAASTAPTLVPKAPDLSVQTERGSKSIAGAPTAGSNPVRKQPSNSIKEAIRRAAAAAG